MSKPMRSPNSNKAKVANHKNYESAQRAQICEEGLNAIMVAIEKLVEISIKQQDRIAILTDALSTVQKCVADLQSTAINNFIEANIPKQTEEAQQAGISDDDIFSSGSSERKKIVKTIH